MKLNFTAVAVVLLHCFIVNTQAINTVTSLNATQYVGRWYQVYADAAVDDTFERNAVCVTADYGLLKDEKISVLNCNRVSKPTGSQKCITGDAYVPDKKQPGKLKVQLEGVPFEGDYWVVKLGPVVEDSYQYSVVTDSLQITLFVLTRNADAFKAKYDADVINWLKNNGFTHFYNKPTSTYQGKDCLYPTVQVDRYRTDES